MRKLIYAINTSLDGYCDHDKFYPGDDVMAYFIQLTRDADTFVYGRTTYELMVPFWPDLAKNPSDEREIDNEFARAFDEVKKIVVFSKSLTGADDARVNIHSSGLEDEILKLKQESGKAILTGGIDIPTQLAKLGLIDEFRFIVAPVVVGSGRRLFDGINLPEKLQLKLVESKVYKSGAVALRYVKS